MRSEVRMLFRWFGHSFHRLPGRIQCFVDFFRKLGDWIFSCPMVVQRFTRGHSHEWEKEHIHHETAYWRMMAMLNVRLSACQLSRWRRVYSLSIFWCRHGFYVLIGFRGYRNQISFVHRVISIWSMNFNSTVCEIWSWADMSNMSSRDTIVCQIMSSSFLYSYASPCPHAVQRQCRCENDTDLKLSNPSLIVPDVNKLIWNNNAEHKHSEYFESGAAMNGA